MKLILLTLVLSGAAEATRIPTNETIQREGKRIYLGTCVRCHNVDPRKAGSIGPELYTTPLDVFRTKVPEGKYPSGYTPKRRTKIMPKFPDLTNKVDWVYDYVRSFK
jgi:mono/diheme cytochrome c family protein